MASVLASKFEVHSTVIFCGFQSVAKLVEHKLTSLVGSLIKQTCDNVRYLRDATCKTLIIHGKKVP